MPLKTEWWVLLALTLAHLAFDLYVLRGHRRNGVPLPAHAAGNVTGNLGFLLLVVGALLDSDGALAWGAIAGSAALLGVSITLQVAASRRARR